MKARSFNAQVFLEFISYLIFGGYMFYFITSDKYLLYVTPKMKPYLYFTAIIMIIWACMSLFRMFRPHHKIRAFHFLVLVLPSLLLLLPHKPLDMANLASNYAGGSTFYQGTSNRSNNQALSDNSDFNLDSIPGITENDFGGEEITQPDTANSSPEDTVPSSEDNSLDLTGLDKENKIITVSNEEFYPWIAEIYGNLDAYEGYMITITGFVFNDMEYFEEDEFVAARLAMVCCAADLAPIGILCRYDKASELASNEWITVEGEIIRGQYEGQVEPQIAVTSIMPALEIKGYIYPY
ncbi:MULTISPECIES: TIGR03943 family putative permease subunit [unclassified Sedimentibacter]|uniref:TIGR03943 family putative permease subunit n=1 Tax=unclassified Sedimentibacter TaxID=2649220 RepID=UPI0027E1089F|nr:TIGR03943 family protein [Sedimentibacter sp. MB35-C1]WMJ75892.1 TIGR03943 family protein [Sedimentibacter sp. MB35-C1]